MKEHAVKQKVKKHLGFYLVLMLCMAMISFACWYAYEQTKNQIRFDLNSAVGDIKVMEVQTDIPKPTEPVTEPETIPEIIPETKAETVHTKPIVAQPIQTAPVQTQPVMQEAAVIDAPETAPVVSESESETESIAESVMPTSAEPLRKPIEGEIIEDFSNGELVKSKTTGIWQTHNGIDIAGTVGDAVCAAGAGLITNIENDALWGVTVTIDHQNGLTSRYCNLNSGLAVSVGDRVETGTVLGAIGTTADIESSLPAHLHFELLQGENYLNPAEYLTAPEQIAETES
ncbi:MAG: peptidoglycan DD-metalloendopeptidase family protein [Oscillospiraceae bacterium]|nr:peptidoglycan DD-metalloendopeptidase family protein [Oscillospiraceae bacterium]